MQLTNPHNLPGDAQLMDLFEAKLAKVFFYQNIVIVEASPGAVVNYKTGFELLVKGINYIDHKPWVYISNRINEYHPDPSSFKYLNLAPYLKGVAIVAPNKSQEDAFDLGAKYFKKQFAVFNDLISAYNWAQKILGKESATE